MKNQHNNRIRFNYFASHLRSRFWILFLILYTCHSCQLHELEHWPISYPPEVEKEVNLFLDYAPGWVEARPLTIVLTGEIVSDGKVVVGLSSKKDNSIYLDTTSYSWKHARTKLVLHELGHYVLDRKHTYDTAKIFDRWEGFPKSLMHYKISKPSDWNLINEDLLNYYLEELFTPIKWTDG